PANDIPRHLTGQEYRLYLHGLIAQDLGPMREERIPVAWWEGGHPVCVRVALLREQNGEVVVDHVAQSEIARQAGRGVSVHVCLIVCFDTFLLSIRPSQCTTRQSPEKRRRHRTRR